MLHYNPQHVSSSTLFIFRKTNCITTTSGIITLEIGERSYINKMRSAAADLIIRGVIDKQGLQLYKISI